MEIATMTVDTTTLAAIINQCFAFSADGRFSDQQQSSFLADGKRLRGLLMNLLSAQFNDGTQAVLDANSKLTDVNTQLNNDAGVLNNIATTLTNVSNLVGILDKLLNVAASFV
jgi:geranylgeranyl pyrophosphate synthase